MEENLNNSDIDEFDQEFYLNHPNIAKSQQILNMNLQNPIRNDANEHVQIPSVMLNECQVKVNSANNFSRQSKKFGLNQNKRGKIKENDIEMFKATFAQLQSNVQDKYFSHGHQTIQKTIEEKLKNQKQFEVQKTQSLQYINSVLNRLAERISGIHEQKLRDLNLLEKESAYEEKKVPEIRIADIEDKMNIEEYKDSIMEQLREEIRQELLNQIPGDQQLQKQVNTALEKVAANNQNQQQIKGRGTHSSIKNRSPVAPVRNSTERKKREKTEKKNKQRVVQSYDMREKALGIQILSGSSSSSSGKSVKQSQLKGKKHKNATNQQSKFSQFKTENKGEKLEKYKFGQIQPQKQKSISQEQNMLKMPSNEQLRNSASLNMSSQKPDDVDSDEWEENLLRHSYDNYGKMLSSWNMKKKEDRKIKELKNDCSDEDNQNQAIEEIKEDELEHSSDQSDSDEVYDQQLKDLQKQLRKQEPKKKVARSSSLGNVLQNEGADSENMSLIQRRQLQSIANANRGNSSNRAYKIIYNKRSRRQSIQAEAKGTQDNLIENKLPINRAQFQDDLALQNIENYRSTSQELAENEEKKFEIQEKIKQIFHWNHRQKRDIKRNKAQHSENIREIKMLLESLSGLNMDIDMESILHLSNKEISVLRDLVQAYQQVPLVPKTIGGVNQKDPSSQRDPDFDGSSQKDDLEELQSNQDSNEDEANTESAASNDSDVENNDLIQTPSLREINRAPSYRSIDSNLIRNWAVKYEPKSFKKSKPQVQQTFTTKSRSERSDSVHGEYTMKKEKLSGLELDYHEYLQTHQGFFITRCQMMNIELQTQFKKVEDLEKKMMEVRNFKKLQKEIQQDDVYRGLQTIIIDIENTLVSQIEVKSLNEIKELRQMEHFNRDYIIIKRNIASKQQMKSGDKDSDASQRNQEELAACCEFNGTNECVCDHLVFQVRPYTYHILRGIQPFFEIVVFSKMHHKILEHIIDHIESVLNKPIKDFLEKYKRNNVNSSFQRVKRLPNIKIYFQFIIHQRQYVYLKQSSKWIENLLVLTRNRHKDNLIFISSNPYRIVAAMRIGVLTIPVIQYQSFYRDDFQLSLLEHYILRIRHLKDMKSRLRNNFKFLLQRIDQQKNSAKTGRDNNLNYSRQSSVSSQRNGGNGCEFDIGSTGTFGGQKSKKSKKTSKKEELPQQQKKIGQTKLPSQVSSFRPKFQQSLKSLKQQETRNKNENIPSKRTNSQKIQQDEILPQKQSTGKFQQNNNQHQEEDKNQDSQYNDTH